MNQLARGLAGFFDRVYLIHLPERVDRYVHLKRELAEIGLPIDSAQVTFMEGQWPESPNGFASLGAYGNFMSHLRILREAHALGLEHVWIMEDDVIFRRMLRSPELQAQVVSRLARDDWHLAYIGHKIAPKQLLELRGPGSARSAVEMIVFPPQLEFLWAHCYGVSRQGIEMLLPYLEETLVNPPLHPRGGRMYIDGALNLFRQWHPEAVTLVSAPNLSSQKGSVSSLAQRKAYDQIGSLQPVMRMVRGVRDDLWKLRVLR